MNRNVTVTVLTVALVALGGAWHHFHAAGIVPRVTTVPVSRGDIVRTVESTGTLNAVETVNVGSQVSGTIKELDADFNDIVRKGQVLARLDTALFEAEVGQAQANLDKTIADAENQRVAVDDARRTLGREQALVGRAIAPQSDADVAQVAYDTAVAQLKQAEAAVVQARAALAQSRLNLTHAVITSPIDGIVVARDVDRGQTVAASFQTPSLFEIAEDLRSMQLLATVDESDIGPVRAGQTAHFRVDAYPDEEFPGVVTEVRLEPNNVQNVVTYTTVIRVANPDLRLKPGMTANVSIEVGRHDDVVRVPTAALRFRPSEPVLAALHEAQVAPRTRGAVPATFAPGMTASVWVSTGGRLEPRTVRVGLSDSTYAEIAQGLSEGARVATAAVLSPTVRVAAGSRSPLAPTPRWVR
jgi:HlyD family secretion protein